MGGRHRSRGLIAKVRCYGGTFAHRDIAFEFGSWLNPEFKLYARFSSDLFTIKRKFNQRIYKIYEFKRPNFRTVYS
jgi:hypothetical protein